MKIAIVSKLWEETSPSAKGGTGIAVGNLVNGLVEKGHHVTLFATGNSKTKAQRLISVKKYPYKNDYSEVLEYRNIAEAFSRAKEFDIIHCAVEHKSVLFGDLSKTPSLHSIRYGEFFKDEIELLKRYKHLNFVTVSKAMIKKFPFIKFKGYVHNGLDLKKFPYNEKPSDYLLFLTRLSPQKGTDIAVKLAKKTNQKLILAGKLSETDKKYLNEKVFKYVDGKQIKYVGYLNFKEKIKYLKNAKAVIQPNQIPEAFGNTFIEALACGTPVITLAKGAEKEVVGPCGFVINIEKQMEKAIRNVGKIKRQDCRRRVEKYFTVDKMVDGYLKIYKKIIKK